MPRSRTCPPPTRRALDLLCVDRLPFSDPAHPCFLPGSHFASAGQVAGASLGAMQVMPTLAQPVVASHRRRISWADIPRQSRESIRRCMACGVWRNGGPRGIRTTTSSLKCRDLTTSAFMKSPNCRDWRIIGRVAAGCFAPGERRVLEQNDVRAPAAKRRKVVATCRLADRT